MKNILIEYHVRNLVRGVEPQAIEGAKNGIEAVWNRHAGVRKQLEIIFARSFTDLPNAAAAFIHNEDHDQIFFSMQNLRAQAPLTVEQTAFLYGAHEAMHMVQAHQGDPAETRHFTGSAKYETERHEIEAWEKALQAFKSTYPSTPLRFTIYGDRVWDVENLSKKEDAEAQ